MNKENKRISNKSTSVEVLKLKELKKKIQEENKKVKELREKRKEEKNKLKEERKKKQEEEKKKKEEKKLQEDRVKELLIEEVRLKSCLWDRSCKEYRHKRQKEQAWDAISGRLQVEGNFKTIYNFKTYAPPPTKNLQKIMPSREF